MPEALVIIAAALALWMALCLTVAWWLAPWLGRRCGGDPVTGAMRLVICAYCRLLHGVRHEGQEALRDQVSPGPLIVVSNHTAAIDPLLIQSGCRFRVRWMMASDMMAPALDWLWKRERIIAVDPTLGDAPAREAIRHVRAGGVLGLFPEGGIERPAETLMPFLEGVGLIVARTRAPVLLVWISGTPFTPDSPFASLLAPSRSRVAFIELLRLPEGMRAREIVRTLEERLAEASGWPRAGRGS